MIPGWLLFLYGFAAGGIAGLMYALHVNNSWYRKARETATAITNDFTEALRMAAHHIPDKEIADELIAQANKCDEVWR